MKVELKNVIPLYAALVMVWALTPLAIVWSVHEIPRMWALVFRFVFAAPMIALVLLILRVKLPLNRTAVHSYLAGSFGLFVSQLFTYVATSYISSGMIALMFGFAPVVAGLLSYVLYRHRLSGVQWLGMAVAIVGLYVNMLGGGANARVDIKGVLAMFVAITLYAGSIFWVKHINARVPAIAQASGSIFISLLMALCITPFIWADIPTTMPSGRTMVALAYLVFASSILAMFFYFNLMQKVSATTLSLATVITPALAVGFGILLNDEPFRFNIVIGTALALTGLTLYFSRDLRAAWSQRRA